MVFAWHRGISSTLCCRNLPSQRPFSLTFLVWIFIIVFASPKSTSAFSTEPEAPLSEVLKVSSLLIESDGIVPSSSNAFTLRLELPLSTNYNHLQRRWWTISDPNNDGYLDDLLIGRQPTTSTYSKKPKSLPLITSELIPSSFQSEKLYSYLTRNSSLLELPAQTQVFKFVLTKNSDISNIKVFTIDEDGELIPDSTDVDSGAFKGIAYRQVSSYNQQSGLIQHHFKPVGWARIVINGLDSSEPKIKGTWKVDDEEGLGVPAAIYHVNSAVGLQKGRRDLKGLLARDIETSTSGMFVWRDQDMRIPSLGDMYRHNPNADISLFVDDDGLDNLAHGEPHSDLTKRQSDGSSDTGSSGFSSGTNLQTTIGNTAGCPTRRMIALVGLAADCNYLADFNSSSEARENLINIVNTASQVYENAFNITLGISSIVLSNNSACPTTTPPNDGTANSWNYKCDDSSSVMSDRLSRFSQWRGTHSDDGIASWSLMTDCSQGAVVGLSWLGMVCQTTSNQANGNGTYVSGVNVVSRTNLDWRVYAHELGHSFGAVHDCTSDTCAQNLQASSGCCPFSTSTCNAGGQFLMNPASSASEDQFSPCTIGNICSAMGRNSVNSTCLTSNTGVKLVTTNECGNGIVEEGEECDCGGESGCANNSCCNPTTCKFRDGAVCDDINDACCSGCQFASSKTLCRESQGSCDPAEFCTGNSTSCPSDIVAPNGQSCTNPNQTDISGLTCISGHCTNRDLQCVTLLANTTLLVDGSVLNVTRACDDDSSCQLSCEDPSFGSVCFTTSQNFLDGTPCLGSGRCQRGSCIGGGSFGGGGGGGGIFGGGAGSWFSTHQGVVIGIAAAVGGIVLLLIVWGYMRRCFRRNAVPKPVAATQVPNLNPYYVPPPPLPPQQFGYSQYPVPPPYQNYEYEMATMNGAPPRPLHDRRYV